jgi:hypothetical protein
MPYPFGQLFRDVLPPRAAAVPAPLPSARAVGVTFEVAKGLIRLGNGPPEAGARVEKLSFDPRAVVLWWALATDPLTSLGNRGGIGVAAQGSDQAALAWAADDAVMPGVLGGWSSDAAFLGCGDPRGSSSVKGIVRFLDDGFALDYEGRTDGIWDLHYLAFGGSDLRAAAVVRAEIDDSGTSSVRGLGFEPDFLLFLPGAGAPTCSLGAGLAPAIGVAAAASEQAAAGFAARVDGIRTVARGAFRDDAVIALPEANESGAYAVLAGLDSFDRDGFTLSTDGSSRPSPLACLALAGGTYAVGTAAAGRRGGRVVRKVGFDPAGLLVFSSGLDPTARVRDIGRLCVGGAAAGRSMGAVTWSVRNLGAWPLEPRARSTTENVLEVLDTTSGDLHAGAAVEAMGRGRFSLAWVVSDRNPRNLAYVAFGPAAIRSRQRVRWWRRLPRMLRQ